MGQTLSRVGSDSRFDKAGDSGLSPKRLGLIRYPVERMHRDWIDRQTDRQIDQGVLPIYL